MKNSGQARLLVVFFTIFFFSLTCFAAHAFDRYDVIVVGGGAAGSTAALSAAQSGAKVLLIEKTGGLNGTSLFTDGMAVAGSSMQKAAGVKLTVMDVFKELEEYTHLLFNARLARRILGESNATLEWLIANGAKFHYSPVSQQYLHTTSVNGYHTWEGKQGLKALAKALEKNKNAEIKYFTEGRKILMSSDGRIEGIEALDENGRLVKFRSKAVIIATGGFIGNDKMLGEAGAVDSYPLSWLDNDGVGLEMAWGVGAVRFKDDVQLYHATALVNADGKMGHIGLMPFIHIPILWVDSLGKRYYNEEYVYDNALVSNALVSIGGQGMVVFDQATVDRFKVSRTGLHDSFAQIASKSLMSVSDTMDKSGQSGPLPNVEQDLAAAQEDYILYKGKTLEELAKKAGFDKTGFINQIKDYNKYVKTGVDEQFGKPKKYLMYSVKKGPFYALKVKTVNLATTGGIKVNEDLEAIDLNSRSIKGLYAVGNVSAANIFQDSYPTIEGLALCYATVSGYLAGEHSAKYVKSLK